MEVINCRECGRLFNHIAGPRICQACARKVEDKFQEVKRYLQENPNSNIDDLSKATDTSIKQIKQWVREERLTFSETSLQGIECEKCGKMIRTGRFCEACKGKMQNVLESALDKPKRLEPAQKRDREGDRMRFLKNQ